MNSKEIGFLFRIAISCALDDVRSIRLGESNTVTKKIMSIILNNLDVIETKDLTRMYSMIYSYFNSEITLGDSIAVDDFISIYQNPRKSEQYMAFSDLLLEEIKKRAKRDDNK